MTIDSHQHFWKYDPIRDAWITDEMKIIQRDFLPKDLQPILDENGIDGCVAVQADQSEEETLFLVNYANQHDFIKGVVGWVDLCSDRLNEQLEHLTSFKKLKGFRHIVQTEPDVNFLLREDVVAGIKKLQRFNFTYDVLIYPKQLETAVAFVSKFPNQKFVIDHMAKPFIKTGQLDNWEKHMRALAAFDNVYCKVSGIVTEADWRNWLPQHFMPYLDVVLDSFGTKKLMYGSDWPVCLVAASYQQQINIVKQYISKLSASEQSDIMGDNAFHFYNLIL